MHVSDFLTHWGLVENPFAAEEARRDAVFAKLSATEATHPDFEKILGSLERPSASIVFGEKGSGKTAIRLQLAQRVARWNDTHRDQAVLFVAYDDANPFLDSFLQAWASQRSRKVASRRRREERDANPLLDFTLADHMDAILSLAVRRFVDALLGDEAHEHDAAARVASLRSAPLLVRRRLLMLQALYDEPSRKDRRRRLLQRRLRIARWDRTQAWRAAASVLWIAPLWLAYMRDFFLQLGDPRWSRPLWLGLVAATAGLWAVAAWRGFVWEALRLRGLARRLAKALRSLGLAPASLRRAVANLPRAHLAEIKRLLAEDPLEARFELFESLLEAMRAAGYAGAIVVVDRVDEPVAVSGDPDRMRAFVWPLLNNKFLQMEGVGFKLLLPIELRHALMRESSAFFQEARLDKQALIEQLAWTGATLYDLCNARLRAAWAPDESKGGEQAPPTLVDLFDEDVHKQDLIDALEQMRQPRDAFKLLYQCMQEHCARVTNDAPVWRIPRHVLETVRRMQAERVQLLARGVRPA